MNIERMADGSCFPRRWVLLFFVIFWCSLATLSLAEGSSNESGGNNNCSAINVSSSAILLNWSAGSRHALKYLVHYWPVYHPDGIRNVTISERSSYRVSGLEAQTLFQFTILSPVGHGQGWSRLCTVFRRTGQQTYPVRGLRQFIINTTTAYVTWKRPSVSGTYASYRVFMDWGSDAQPMSALIYAGNRTNTVVTRKRLPHSVLFHVNVVYEPAEGITTSTGPTWQTTVTEPVDLDFHLNVKVMIYGWNFIHLKWNPVPAWYDNVTYTVIYKTTARAQLVVTSQEDVLLSGLQQFTTYLLRVRAQRSNNDVIVTSKWISVRTADQDECSSGHHVCHEKATCINTRGSYSCICHEGLIGDGHVCTVPEVKIADVQVFCPANYENRILWPRTATGQKQTMLCPKGTTGVASRRCLVIVGSPEWDVPDMSECVTDEIGNIHKQLEGPDVDPLPVANKLVHVTADRDKQQALYPGDIRLVVSAVNTLSRDSMQQLMGERPGSRDYQRAKTLSKAVLQSSSNILDPSARSSWKYMTKEQAEEEANNLIESLDEMAAQLAKAANTSQPLVTKTPNVVMSVRGIPTGASDITDQRLPPYDDEDMRDDIPSSVTIPSSVIRGSGPGKDHQRRLTFVSFTSIKDLLQLQENSSSPRGHINSPVVSVTLAPLDKNAFDDPVIITIKRSQIDSTGEPTCVFLNVTKTKDKHKRLSWSHEGCKVGATNASHTECHCYHLTSFAILMQVNRADKDKIEVAHQFALSLITYIGIGLSLVALIVVFITFTFMRFLRSPRHFIHANLAISLALAETVFLFGINRTEYQLVCKILAIAMHYLFLVAFSWMALEGVILYMMLVKVFHSSVSGRKMKTIFFTCGWGLPVVVVAVSSAVYHEGYGTEMFCWLSLDRQFIWAFVAPVLAVIAFNFVCLGKTFYVMANRGNNGCKQSRIDKIRYWARSCCLLTCILGVTWLLGIFFVNKETLVMAYLFSILNALQGLVIFLLHCVGDHKIRAAYHRLIQCNPDPLSSTSGGRLVTSRSTRDNMSESRRGRRLEKQSTMTSLIKSPYVIEKRKASIPSTPKETARISHNCDAQVLDENNASIAQEEVEMCKVTEEKATITLLQRLEESKPLKEEWV